jgi:glycosyltransferase involved in cell wall biosynthesis
MCFLPKVLLVGGPDVDARLELMHCLKDAFNFSAFGSDSTLHDRFLAEGFGYSTYNLSRRGNPVLDLLTLGQLVLMFRRLKPQIVHTFDTKPGVWARLGARLAGVPIIIGTLPGLGSLYASDSLRTRLVRLVYERLQTLACRLTDLTVFQNHKDARQFVAAGVVPEQKATVILGSGVPTNLFNPARVSDVKQTQLRTELGIRPYEIVVTMVSRVIRSKGVLEFMVAAREVGTRYPNVRFLLVGPNDDDSVDRLNSAELLQLKQTVTWSGPRRDIPVVLAISDISVLPSAYREGIPRVLLEAASMGLPIVTTDSPGCNEVAKHNVNGFLVPARNPAALSRAILRLTEQPELRQRFGEASRRRAIEHFDLSIIAEQTRAVYQQLLAFKVGIPSGLGHKPQHPVRLPYRGLPIHHIRQ